MARYVPSAVPNTGDIAQLQRWLREELDRVRNSTDDIYEGVNVSFDNLVGAAYADMVQFVFPPPDVGPVDGTYRTFTNFTLPSITPKGMVPDVANNGIRYPAERTYLVGINASATCDAGAGGRRLSIQLVNTLNGDELGAGYETFVPAGATGITVGIVFPFQMLPAFVEQPIGFRYRSFDGTFTSFTWTNVGMWACQISEPVDAVRTAQHLGRKTTTLRALEILR